MDFAEEAGFMEVVETEVLEKEIEEDETKRSNFCPFEQKAMDSYDEDLSENPFLQSFLTSCPELFSQVVLEQWLICVPRRDSLPKYAFNLEDFTNHILRPLQPQYGQSHGGRHPSGESTCSSGSMGSLLPPPSYDGSSFFSEDNSSFFKSQEEEREARGALKGNWNFQTLTQVNVELSAQTLILDVELPIDDGKFVQLRKEVLFEETFYTSDRRKYKVLCVASPLNSKVDIEDEGWGSGGLGIWNLTSLRDCIDFIWVKGSLKILEGYDALVKLFLHNHAALESLPLPIQRNLVHGLYLKCLEYAEGTGMTMAENLALSDFLRQKLKLATETYVLNGVYRSLISAITSVTATEDAFINKITRNLNEIHPQDLDIRPAYWNALAKARYELGRISSYSSPLGKLSCMKRTIRHIKSGLSAENSTSSEPAPLLCTDELIPIWVYIIVKNPLGNWVAQLEFLRNFRFASIDSVEKDSENSFYIATLEASLEHLKSGKVIESFMDPERDIGSPSDMGEAWLYSLHQEAFESNNPRLAEFFEQIRFGNCQRLEELIEEYEVERYEHNKQRKKPKMVDPGLLCHPLCHCGKCSALYCTMDEEPPMPGVVELTTEDGLSLLHVACIYGRPKIVDILIGCGSNVEAQDMQGNTALHYSASRGHQNALLLLLHAGCGLEPQNNARNTPLHMASQNGHEGCVKALIYYAEHVGKTLHLSLCNAKGDTPLHFASRWGFIGIVSILTEHGAAITIPNGRHATPIDCAHDIHVLKILQRSMRRRSLVQTNHGDYVNIEMMQKEDSGRVVMLISEPRDPSPYDNGSNCPTDREDRESTSRSSSRSGSRAPSRKTSVYSGPARSTLTPRETRSRKISSIRPPTEEALKKAAEEMEEKLNSIARHLAIEDQDPSNPDFVSNNVEDFYDPTEQNHLRRVEVESLNNPQQEEETESKRDHDIEKLFTAIGIGDVTLALFYLGIPAGEVDNPENGEDAIRVLPPCHPLCPCFRCVAKSSGLGLSLDTKGHGGLAPLHLAVQHHVLILVKILIKYGADINLQSTVEKKTALDFAIERGFDDIEQVLLASGAQSSNSFCPEECEM